MKKPILQKQSIKKLNSDYRVVNFLFIALIVVILLSLGYSFYRINADESESFSILPITMVPILILLGSKRSQIKKEIALWKSHQ